MRFSKHQYFRCIRSERRGIGKSLVVKAMAAGREAAQRIHEYLMRIGTEHVSLYDYYFTRRTSGRYYRDMLDGKEEVPRRPRAS